MTSGAEPVAQSVPPSEGGTAPECERVPVAPAFGLQDQTWGEDDWRELLTKLVREGLVTWKDVAALSLGHMNPSQVGTSLASSKGFKKRYGKGNTMQKVLAWVYSQPGKCVDCGTRVELQADHVQGRETFTDPLDADFIENMTLRCRRHNVAKRASHTFAGSTFLTAESALMWILLVLRPRTLKDYIRMCRLYGMTMSDIRMYEAWAMAKWLSNETPPKYFIDDGSSRSDIELWESGAVTRSEVGTLNRAGVRRLYSNVSNRDKLGIITSDESGKIAFFEFGVIDIPISTYDLGSLAPYSLAFRYIPPNRKKKIRSEFAPLPPRGKTLLAHEIRSEHQEFSIVANDAGKTTVIAPGAVAARGKRLVGVSIAAKVTLKVV